MGRFKAPGGRLLLLLTRVGAGWGGWGWRERDDPVLVL